MEEMKHRDTEVTESQSQSQSQSQSWRQSRAGGQRFVGQGGILRAKGASCEMSLTPFESFRGEVTRLWDSSWL
jgi:hypothetical protein